VVEDCNYLGENKIFMQELLDLPDEDAALMLTDEILCLPPTVRIEETVHNQGDLKAEITVKLEEDMLQKIETPSCSQTGENRREEYGESLPDDGPSKD
jgi:hypothetical protein